MCRIVGIVDFKNSLGESLEPVLISMRDSLAHGGPDDAGIYINKDRKVAFGHRRLSIIDLTSFGHQPMSNKEKTIWITYNGEIYNFQELRDELIKCGYQFQSKTDTEVIIYGYEKWGIEELLSRLRGMFAFALYDSKKSSLILARDRFGIKPLYYYKDSGKFIFASEVKAIIKSKLVPDEINREALVGFLQLGSVPAPLTTVKNVFSLPAAHYMIVNEDRINLKQYWDLSFCFGDKKSISFNEAVSHTRELLLESVKLHLISDVPLGVFLSGGIDSSALVALASKVREKPLTTLSITFNEDNFNEAEYSRLVANRFNTNHHEILLTSSDFYKEIPNIFSAMDQPSIDGVNTYFISKVAKEVGLTVVLSGIGGDEVFLGYDHFKRAKYLENSLKLFNLLPAWVRKSSINMLAGCGALIRKNGLKKLSYFNEPSDENTCLAFRGLFTLKEIQELLGISETEFQNYNSTQYLQNGFVPSSLVNLLDYFDFKHYLQNQVLKDADFMSMAHAVEVRVPFLDHILVENVTNLPTEFKLSHLMNKQLLVKAVGNDLPREVWDRPKMGFTFPFGDWMKENIVELQSRFYDQDIFDKKALDNVLNDFNKGKIHWSRVWGLLVGSIFFNKIENLV